MAKSKKPVVKSEVSDEKLAEKFSPYIVLWQKHFRRWLEHCSEVDLDEMFRLEGMIRDDIKRGEASEELVAEATLERLT